MFKGRGAVFVAAALGLLTAFTAQPAAAAPGPTDLHVVYDGVAHSTRCELCDASGGGWRDSERARTP